MKILLVEDDLFLNQLYVDLLNDAGYELDSVMDGDLAFEKMHVGGYDLVLLDMMLPGMSGIEVLQKLSKQPSLKKNKKIVFLTNTDNSDDLKKIKSMSNGYMLKSAMTPDQFQNNVKALLNL